MTFKVDLHTHTLACAHAYSTLREYADEAAARGIVLFATTDHGPALPDAPHPWHYNNFRVIPRVFHGTGVLCGVEANILPGGQLDLSAEVLSRLDIVLAGFHNCYTPAGKKQHTADVIRIIESGQIDILAHPGNPVYELDLQEVIACAAAHNVAVEINSTSGVNTRLGSHPNCVKAAALAMELGAVITLGSDAHIADWLARFDEAEAVLREAGVPHERVLNSDPLAVLSFLESRGHKAHPDLKDWLAARA